MQGYNHIFDVKANSGNQHLRGFLDIKSKEIIIYDDYNGKELFRIGNNNYSGGSSVEEKYEKAIISLEIRNSTNSVQTATLFAANREPLIQPMGVTVIVKEIQSEIFNSHNYLRRSILSNPIRIHGMKYYAEDSSQFNHQIRFGYIPPSGREIFYNFIPKNFMSTFQHSRVEIEAPNFRGIIDANTQVLVPVNPKSTCELQFTAFFKRQSINSSGRRSSIIEPRIIPIDSYNQISGEAPKRKSNLAKILLAGTMISLIAANIYLFLKIEKKI